MYIRKLLNNVIDFIFPPNEFEMELRDITAENVFDRLPEANPTEFPFINSVFSYRNPLVKELIWQIKYKKNKHALSLAGYALNKKLLEYPRPFLLIPIPISSKRRRERGYNQCELIIDEIIKINPEIQADFSLLIRDKNIDKQTFKNKSQRIENTKDIFEVTKSSVMDQMIIVIDDVSTTGSTLNEARESLLRAGYKDIIGLTLAH